MAYLIERKSQTIFVTATSIIANGKPREMIVESRPEYAVVQLAGVPGEIPSAVGRGLPGCDAETRVKSSAGARGQAQGTSFKTLEWKSKMNFAISFLLLIRARYGTLVLKCTLL